MHGKRELSRRDLILAGGAVTAGGVLVGVAASASNRADVGPTAGRPTKPVPVAVLIGEGATMIDFSGPWEVFQDAFVADVPGFELFTIAAGTSPIRASGGMTIVPDYALENAPAAKVVVIPAQVGSRQPISGDPKVSWLRSRFASADVIMSVCTGAFLLARTGLLNGLSATTHHNYLADFAGQFPKVKLLKNQRFVDEGKLITTGGLSSGIEGALHVVERYYGRAAKTKVANYMEYVSHTWSEAQPAA